MVYVGSKNKYANEILKIILKNRKKDQWYVEPFCGGCNIIDKVSGNRIGNDYHYYLIELFKKLQEGWVPPQDISEEEYKEVKNNKEKHDPWYVGYVGFAASYSGKWFGGYARNKERTRNYPRERYNNILAQIQNIKDVVFYNLDYTKLEIPRESIIYCDPPYCGTTDYSGANNFDSEKFFKWCIEKVDEGHDVFVSEYDIPEKWKDYFELVWEKKTKTHLMQEIKKSERTERLFKSKKTK